MRSLLLLFFTSHLYYICAVYVNDAAKKKTDQKGLEMFYILYKWKIVYTHRHDLLFAWNLLLRESSRATQQVSWSNLILMKRDDVTKPEEKKPTSMRPNWSQDSILFTGCGPKTLKTGSRKLRSTNLSVLSAVQAANIERGKPRYQHVHWPTSQRTTINLRLQPTTKRSPTAFTVHGRLCLKFSSPRFLKTTGRSWTSCFGSLRIQTPVRWRTSLVGA